MKQRIYILRVFSSEGDCSRRQKSWGFKHHKSISSLQQSTYQKANDVALLCDVLCGIDDRQFDVCACVCVCGSSSLITIITLYLDVQILLVMFQILFGCVVWLRVTYPYLVLILSLLQLYTLSNYRPFLIVL
jgi:hypothetical protein